MTQAPAKDQPSAIKIDAVVLAIPWWDLDRYVLWVATRDPPAVRDNEGRAAFEKVKARATQESPDDPEKCMLHFGHLAKLGLEHGIEAHAIYPYTDHMSMIDRYVFTRLILHCSAAEDTAYITWMPAFHPPMPLYIAGPFAPSWSRDMGPEPLRFKNVLIRATHAVQAFPPVRGKIVPKTGPRGGRPTSMSDIKAELADWRAGGKRRLVDELERWTPGEGRLTMARIARALEAWCREEGGNTPWKTIQRAAASELREAYRLL